MAEYIKREDVLEEYDKWIESTGALPKGTSYYYECKGCIEEVPAADVAPVKHGKWELVEETGSYDKVKCSCCKKLAFSCKQIKQNRVVEITFIHTPYCPHCGARMTE